jgi:hypothetical protein
MNLYNAFLNRTAALSDFFLTARLLHSGKSRRALRYSVYAQFSQTLPPGIFTSLRISKKIRIGFYKPQSGI